MAKGQVLRFIKGKEKGAAAGSNSLIVRNKQFYVGGYKELSVSVSFSPKTYSYECVQRAASLIHTGIGLLLPLET